MSALIAVIVSLVLALIYAQPSSLTPAEASGQSVGDLVSMMGGHPWREGLEDVPVLIVAENPHGLLGLACDRRFAETPGNAQALCAGFQGVVLYPPALESRALLLNVLHHEDYHLTHTAPGAPEDVFDEAGAYRAGCAYSPVSGCAWWLEHHPVVTR